MSEYVAATITVRRVIDDNDNDVVQVEWDEDGRLIELLGMVEYARDSILRAYMTDDDTTD